MSPGVNWVQLKKMICFKETPLVLTSNCYIVSRKTISYNIYRAVLKEAGNMMGARFTVRVNPEIAELLYGEENTLIGSLEKKIGKRVAIYPNPKFHMEEFDILESMGS